MILREFAVDPDVMVEFFRCAYVVDQMGFNSGRMISGFPTWRDWKALVKRACKEADVEDLEKKRIMLRVEKAKSKFIPTDRLYRKQDKWIENVRSQYPHNPFDAVLTLLDEEGIDPCLIVGQFLDDDPAWDVPRGFVIERNAKSMAEVAAPLVLHSRELVFVDPYFDPSDSTWLNPLELILREATQGGRVLRTCEFHCKVRKDKGGVIHTNPTFEEMCQESLPKILPNGVELLVVRWEQMTMGEKLHPRYILTEYGGLSFEVGLDEAFEGKDGETTDVSILDPTVLKQRRADYDLENPAFREAQRVRIRSLIF